MLPEVFKKLNDAFLKILGYKTEKLRIVEDN